MITLWDKATKRIIDQTSDHSLERNYRLKAQGKQLGFHSNPKSQVFPDRGYTLNSNGELVLADPERSPEILSLEERVLRGELTLDKLRDLRKASLYNEATMHLNSTKTTEHGFICSDAAQKICVASIAMKSVPDDDSDKRQMTQDGLLYPLDKAREILAKCAAVTASYRAACAAVDRAQNVAQIQALRLETFL